MKKRILGILLVTFIVLVTFGLNVYAANICTVEAQFSAKKIEAGEEINIEIETTQINEKIAGIGFALYYDTDVFDFISANAESGWTLSQTENLYTIFKEDYESTTEASKMLTITLKAKENVNNISTTIKLDNVDATKDDATTVSLESISQDIIIGEENIQEESVTTKNNSKGIIVMCTIVGVLVVITIILYIRYKKNNK